MTRPRALYAVEVLLTLAVLLWVPWWQRPGVLYGLLLAMGLLALDGWWGRLR